MLTVVTGAIGTPIRFSYGGLPFHLLVSEGHLAGAYLEPSQTSMKKLFYETS